MTQPPLVNVDDLAAWIGQDIPTDGATRAGAVLSGASALVRGFTGKTWVDTAGNLEEVPDVVQTVVLQVAERKWLTKNPNLRTETQGPFAKGYFDSVSAGLYLTDEDKEALSEFQSGSAATGLGTLSMTTGARADSTVYVPTGPPPSGYPFPWYDGSELW